MSTRVLRVSVLSVWQCHCIQRAREARRTRRQLVTCEIHVVDAASRSPRCSDNKHAPERRSMHEIVWARIDTVTAKLLTGLIFPSGTPFALPMASSEMRLGPGHHGGPDAMLRPPRPARRAVWG